MTFKQVQWAAVFLGIAFLEAGLLYKLIKGQIATDPRELILAVCVVGILFVLSFNADSLKLISFGKEGFRAEMEGLQRKTAEIDRAITDLILLSMGHYTYRNLQKLATGAFGKYKMEPHMGLETELYHLRNLGYVALNTEKSRSIHQIPPSGDELSDYVYVTEAGNKYLELREKQAHKE
jgi:hypothetical protein